MIPHELFTIKLWSCLDLIDASNLTIYIIVLFSAKIKIIYYSNNFASIPFKTLK